MIWKEYSLKMPIAFLQFHSIKYVYGLVESTEMYRRLTLFLTHNTNYNGNTNGATPRPREGKEK